MLKKDYKKFKKNKNKQKIESIKVKKMLDRMFLFLNLIIVIKENRKVINKLIIVIKDYNKTLIIKIKKINNNNKTISQKTHKTYFHQLYKKPHNL